ncbi:hypothetical protein VPNG_04168 [Cytospora leucostoma]|uniref:Uncharacterized protein n=1 Tax=Cytospora leucostoma TaxID=1230097 RepID=A0A423XCZ9_9PEZI|nr:hypothetical protein VPNG_04168 [Cytospora leucostoma]
MALAIRLSVAGSKVAGASGDHQLDWAIIKGFPNSLAAVQPDSNNDSPAIDKHVAAINTAFSEVTNKTDELQKQLRLGKEQGFETSPVDMKAVESVEKHLADVEAHSTQLNQAVVELQQQSQVTDAHKRKDGDLVDEGLGAPGTQPVIIISRDEIVAYMKGFAASNAPDDSIASAADAFVEAIQLFRPQSVVARVVAHFDAEESSGESGSNNRLDPRKTYSMDELLGAFNASVEKLKARNKRIFEEHINLAVMVHQISTTVVPVLPIERGTREATKKLRSDTAREVARRLNEGEVNEDFTRDGVLELMNLGEIWFPFGKQYYVSNFWAVFPIHKFTRVMSHGLHDEKMPLFVWKKLFEIIHECTPLEKFLQEVCKDPKRWMDQNAAAVQQVRQLPVNKA